MSDQSRNLGHAGRVANIARGVAILLGIFTAISVVVGLTVGSWSWLLLAGCAAAWAVLGLFLVFHKVVIDRAGDAIGRIIVSSGSSTPSVAQHSNIEAMEMRGDYAKAKDAYVDVIRARPEDVVACEKLAQLAFRQLKDYDTAVWAYRQAEQRTPDPRRRVGYALLALNIIRDNVRDDGRTIVEIRKLLDKYPDARNAAELKAELAELKTRHFEAPSS